MEVIRSKVSSPISMVFAKLVRASRLRILGLVLQKRTLLGISILLALAPGCHTKSSIGPSTTLKQSRTSFVLAQEGKTRLPIIISPHASAETTGDRMDVVIISPTD
jgi:hypothetical protein